MPSYKIEVADHPASGAVLLRVGFADPAQNDTICRDAQSRLNELALSGGPLVLINGPASLPVALVLGHGLSHLFGAVGVFDPKMAAYVVAVSHRPEMKVGDLIPA